MDGTKLADYLSPPQFADRFWPDPQTTRIYLETTKSNLHEASGILYSFISSEVGMAALIGVVLILLVVLVYKSSSRKAKPTGEVEAMRQWERQRQIKQLVGDGFTDHIEKLYYEGKISKGEKAQMYARLAKTFEDDDYVCSRHPSKKKAQIKARRANGINKPVTIPGEAPPTVERRALKPVRTRGMISKIIAANKTA